MVFSVTVLGSSSALPTSNRYLTAHVLNVDERFFLVDCGEGTQFQLRKYKARFSRLNHIFISHLHGDHMFGLPGLISTFNLLGRKQDLHLYAHQDLEIILNQFLGHFFLEMDFKLIFHPLNFSTKELIYEDSRMTVESFPVQHRIPTCGFLFREKPSLKNIKKGMIDYYHIPVREIVNIKKGDDYITEEGIVIPNDHLTMDQKPVRSYAFCADTAYSEAIIPIIKDVDLLYHESTFSDEDADRARETMHSTASQAALIAKQCNAKNLIIGHFSARYKDLSPILSQATSVFPNTQLALEGMEINL